LDPARHADATRLRKAFQARRYVYSVPEDVAAINNDVTDVDANSELNPPVLGNLGIERRHSALNRNGTAHGVHHAREFHQHAVAGGFHDAAVVLGDPGIDQGLPVRLQLSVSAFFVGTHQAAVACRMAISRLSARSLAKAATPIGQMQFTPSFAEAKGRGTLDFAVI
jgi:hypothetical protein